MDCSILIVDGDIQIHDGHAYNLYSERLYLNCIENEDNLTPDFLIEISRYCKALMIDFHGEIEPNHIELEIYEDDLPLPSVFHLGYSWVSIPCSLRLSEGKYVSLRSSLMNFL